jgi:hypothetical protein
VEQEIDKPRRAMIDEVMRGEQLFTDEDVVQVAC